MPPRPYWSRSALTAHLGRLTEGVLKPRNGLRTAPESILRRSDLEVEAVSSNGSAGLITVYGRSLLDDPEWLGLNRSLLQRSVVFGQLLRFRRTIRGEANAFMRQSHCRDIDIEQYA